jgi:hypothetical protein
MKKLLRIAFVLVVVVVVLLIAVAYVIKMKYPPERVRALVLTEVEGKLHRKAQVGDVSISLFNGVGLSDFKLSERPDFSQGSFVECRTFRLGFSLKTILKGKLVLSEIALEKPVIHVVREADRKTFNFSDLTGSAAQSAAAVSPPSSTTSPATAPSHSVEAVPASVAALLVENLKITDGQVNFIDKSPHGTQVSLDHLNFSVKGLSLVRSFKTAMSVDIGLRQDRKSLSARVNMTGKALLPGQGHLELTDLSVSSGKTLLEVTGTIDRLLGIPQVDLFVQLKSFDPTTVAFFAPLPAIASNIGLNGGVVVKGTQNDIQGSGRINLDVAGLKGLLRISDMAYKAGKEPYIRLAAALEDVEPSKALPVKNVSVSGHMSGQVNLEGTLSRMAIALSVDASNLAIQYADLLKKKSGVACKFQLKSDVERQDTATLHELGVTFGPLNLSAKGVVSGLTQKEPRFNLNINLSPLSLNELASMVGSVAAYKPQGTVSANLVAHGTPSNPLAEGTVQLKDVAAEVMPGIPVSGINATVQMKADSMSMPSLNGRLMDSPFKVNLAVQNFAAPHVMLDGSLDKLDVGKVLAALQKKPAAKGTPPVPVPPQAVKAVSAAGPLTPFALKANFTVAQVTHPNFDGKAFKFVCDLTGRGSNPATLKGTASVDGAQGAIHDIPIVSSLASVIDPSLKELSYSSIIAKMNFDAGKMHLTQGDLNGPVSVSATGTYTFENSGLDFAVHATVPANQVSPVIAQYAAVGDVVPLDLTLGGTLDKPKYSLKAAQMIKNKAMDTLKQQAGQALQQGLKNLLKF